MGRELERDVGQLLWLGFEGTTVPADLADDLARGGAGAVILFARNLPMAAAGALDIEALVALNRALHQAAAQDPGEPGLWIAVDQEGGRVQRVRAPATVWPPMLALDQIAGEAEAASLAEDVGLALGRELALLGFDVDFAPVLDVHTNPKNPIIGDRAFATEPHRAARRALAFARGLARAGVVGCGKHFPGHGDTSTDSHLALPRLDHELDRLRDVELVPFAQAVAAGIPMIMTAHIVFSALDADVPATLSPRVITGLLRGQMGYDGLVVSDDLDMHAIADHFGIGEAAVRAVTAGCDALLLCRDPDHQRQAREALLRAAEADSDLRARVARSAARIRSAKQRHARERAALPAPDTAPDASFATSSARAVAAHRDLAARLSQLSQDQ